MKVTATTMQADPERLAWDTEFFGVPVGRATHLKGLTKWANENQVGLVCLLADTVAEVQQAEERGFRLMDVRLTLSRPTTMMSSSARLIRSDEVPALCEIARSAYPLTRFYADPRLSDDRCGDMYAEWTRSLCDGAADVVLVANRKGEPIGYVTVNVDGLASEIGLIAVQDGLRGHGIGADLVRGAIDVAKVRGAEQMTVVTQGLNVGAIRTFEGCGFRTSRTQFWLHKWIA